MTEWKRVKIGEVCRIEKGATGIASATPGDYPLVVTALERKTCSTYQFDCEAVCIPLVSSSGHGKKSLKYVHYQNGKFALGTILAAVIPNDKNELSARYLHQYLQFYKDTLIVPLMHGAANVSLAIRDIEQIEIPLPPIEKQNEFAKLFVRMQENDVELQSEFETQKDLIKKLRQSILQDAIEGKLTEDWRKGMPRGLGTANADACLEMPRGFELPNGISLNESFKDFALAKSNPRGNKKTLPPITDEEKPFEIPESWKWAKKIDNGELKIENFEVPFEIPESWKWVRLGEIIYLLSGQDFSPEKYNDKNQGIPYITGASNIEKNSVIINRWTKTPTVIAYKNDILLVCKGSGYGRFVLADFEQAHIARQIMSIRVENPTLRKIIMFYLETKFSYLKSKGNGLIPGLDRKTILTMAFPLPPLAEQNEIVHQVEKQLAKVEQLEQQVEERENLTKSLFRGILKNAFEGEKYHADSAPLTRMPV